MRRANALEKPLVLLEAEQKEKRAAEGEVARERHQLRGREFERTPRQWRTGEPVHCGPRAGRDLGTEQRQMHCISPSPAF